MSTIQDQIVAPAAQKAKPQATGDIRVTQFPAAELARIRVHAAAAGHTTDAGALRYVALVGLAALDREAAAQQSQAVA